MTDSDPRGNPCPECGRPRSYLMSIDPSKPGLTGLLRGEGDYVTQKVAWLGVLFVAFVVALLLFKLA